MTDWPAQRDTDKFYGNPRGSDGAASAKWERANIVRLRPPWPIVTSWDDKPVQGIRIHRLCADSLSQILGVIWEAAGRDIATIQQWGMHLHGGGYTYRLMRGSNRLSMHSWGCAVDFDPERNGYGDKTPYFAQCPAVLQAFAQEGWTWGGVWTKPDGMHWQAADV